MVKRGPSKRRFCTVIPPLLRRVSHASRYCFSPHLCLSHSLAQKGTSCPPSHPQIFTNAKHHHHRRVHHSFPRHVHSNRWLQEREGRYSKYDIWLFRGSLLWSSFDDCGWYPGHDILHAYLCLSQFMQIQVSQDHWSFGEKVSKCRAECSTQRQKFDEWLTANRIAPNCQFARELAHSLNPKSLTPIFLTTPNHKPSSHKCKPSIQILTTTWGDSLNRICLKLTHTL